MVINGTLNVLMRVLTGFERHHSLDSQAKSLATRLFLVQFLNTACLVLVANADIPVKLSSGVRYRDFDADWWVHLQPCTLPTHTPNPLHVFVVTWQGWCVCGGGGLGQWKRPSLSSTLLTHTHPSAAHTQHQLCALGAL